MAVDSTIKPNGLKTAWDTIVAPKEAFENLRVAPTWGWAFLIVMVIGVLSLYLISPASIHAMAVDWPNQVARNPQLSQLTPQQQQNGLAMGTKIASFTWVFAPFIYLIGALISTIILVIFNAIGGGSGSFGKYWAAQWNIAIVSVMGALVLAIIVMVRGADSFTTPMQVQTALPSLGMLVPDNAVKLHAFLSIFTPFGLWSAGLEIAALMIIGNVRAVPAWIGGSLTLILGGLFAAVFAK
jgi:hypothetical protein